MKNLKEAFKPTPKRFSYAIQEAVNIATAQEKKHFFSKKKVIALTVAAAILLTPATVFGAAQIYKMAVEKEGLFGLSVSSSGYTNSPQYVKLNVGDIENCKEMPNTNGLKYCLETADSQNAAYSFYLSRPQNGAKELYENTNDYKSAVINGNEAVIISGAGLMESTRVCIYFDDVNIILTCYISPEIDEAEYMKALEKVWVTTGDKNNFTSFTTSEEDTNVFGNFEYPQNFIEVSSEVTLNFYENMTGKIENIRIVENVSELDKNDFYFFNEDISNYIDDEGNLTDRVSDEWILGDGVNSTDTFVKSEKKEQVLVLADITYTNNSQTEELFSINCAIKFLDTDKNGKLSYSKDIYSDIALGDGLAQYIENANQGLKDYYCYTLAPNESRTFTVGFRCDKDLLSKAYITNSKDSDLNQSIYAIKVQ